MVYDCIVHPSVIDEAKEDETGNQQNFLCQLGLQYVEQKYKCELDRKYKLPKVSGCCVLF